MREPLDLENQHPPLKTPHADPAADLWSRYATASNTEETPTGVKLPSFAHLLNDSSPHSLPRTPGGSVGGLRRWASCGIEWPASKSKRRKTNGVFRDQPETVLESKESAKEHLERVSRVGFLVEQMQATLAQPTDKLRPDGPSSSSPLPDKGVFGDGPLLSPTNRPPQVLASARRLGSTEADSSSSADKAQDEFYEQGESSEFADDTLLPNDSASQKFVTAPMIPNQLETIDEDFGDLDFDEFDDDDLDLTAEDLDNAVPLFDSKISQNTYSAPVMDDVSTRLSQHMIAEPVVNTEPTRYLSAANVSDDDEFGGSDLDEDQFAAAEVAATQAYHASTATQGSVRNSNLPRV